MAPYDVLMVIMVCCIFIALMMIVAVIALADIAEQLHVEEDDQEDECHCTAESE